MLITGAAGFLGSHLCDYFLARDWRVLGIDSLLTGAAGNLAHLGGDRRFRFLRQDVARPFVVDDPVDLILHFACPASPRDYLRYPIHTLKVDSVGALRTLGLAKARRARYLLASTSEVYGDPQVHPQPEAYWGHVNPIGPRSAYDEAKRFAEALTMAHHRSYGLDTRIVRIFNTYGPRMRAGDGRVIPQFITHALAGTPLPVHGDGRQTRSFCFVDDLVEGIYRLATYDGLAGEVFNLGNPEEVTLLELAETVASLFGGVPGVVHLPLPQDDPTRRRPDIRKAQARLGWTPAVPLREGLRRTIPWFASRTPVQSQPVSA
ncbi:MAG: NAD-dependent dehydratase [Candidatus Rokuibacteriota bacterium]|nr:MAG: NAD-dependent dehydratase [Candidatus Rokubacteria bacterium]